MNHVEIIMINWKRKCYSRSQLNESDIVIIIIIMTAKEFYYHWIITTSITIPCYTWIIIIIMRTD